MAWTSAHLEKIGREIIRRLLESNASAVSAACGDSVQGVVQPTVAEYSEKAPALKLANPCQDLGRGIGGLLQHLIDGTAACVSVVIDAKAARYAAGATRA